ncbi:tudor domain-containing protein 1-like [Anastrepha ludens]|uniref:tudor domain-containing protein 1-like n=1 Tax=Anastrepha ludens TaxID=28586 RepID=UPI0023B06C3A|nr:tudor domain-containing protein 1-like [Anastrepha ludens]
MAFRSNMDRMQTMHAMCARELEQLQTNLSRFLIDSEAVLRNDVLKNSRKESGFPTHANVFALMAYDRYMSRLAAVTNLARKFNIHLQLHNLNKIFALDIGMGLAPDSYLFDEFVEWRKVLWDSDECLDLKPFRSENGPSTATTTVADVSKKVHSTDEICEEKCPLVRKITFATPESLTLEVWPSCVQLRDLSTFVAGYHFSAFVTYVEDIGALSFYACQMRNDMLYELSNMFNLLKSVRMPSTNTVFGISINSKSILRGVLQYLDGASDGGNGNLHVLLIDYGELVPLNPNDVQFYDLPKVYRDLPAQAMKCILLGVKAALDECAQMDACVLGTKLQNYEFKEVNFEVVRKTGRVLFVYVIENREIEAKSSKDKKGEHLSNNPFVNSFNENSYNSDVQPPKTKFDSNKNLKFLLTLRTDKVFKNDIIYLQVMHIDRPDCFHAQILKNKSETLEQLFWNTGEVLLEQKLTAQPKLGDIILAQYAKDEFWYRAKVIDVVDDDVFKVFYLDYGNTETVSLKSMAKCNSAQETAPFRAVFCRFAGITDITNGDESLCEQAVQMLVVMLLNQRIEVRVVQKMNDGELRVELLDKEFAETTQMLVEMGYAKEI